MKVNSIWNFVQGPGPILAAAIHAGHQVREDILKISALSEEDRLREEDPFTDEWTHIADSMLIGTHSRFQVDLNRPREKAFYRTPEDAWGLNLWKSQPPSAIREASLEEYDAFYTELRRILKFMTGVHGKIIVLDFHSYNHVRQGPYGPFAPIIDNPEINIGTGTMDRKKWAPLVDGFIDDLLSYDFMGRKLDVRENVKFRGGFFPTWIHQNFPDDVCALAVEVKKVFMDEWTGKEDIESVEALKSAFASTIPGLLNSLSKY